MRNLLVLAALCTVAAAPQALAQTGSPFSDLMNMATHSLPAHQAEATMKAPGARLPRSAPKWIEEEARRQAASPRRMGQVALDIDEALGKAVLRAARTQGIHPEEINASILLSVMYGAREIVAREKPADPARVERAEADLKAVMPLQSQTSLRMAAAQ